MIFSERLIHGVFINRCKRFLADIKLDDGSKIIAHCPNSGSMKSCLEKGAEVFISKVVNPKRVTRYTWEMIKINNHWIGINTGIPNILVYEAVLSGKIHQLSEYNLVRREVKYGDSRFDIFAENEYEKCFIEVKNVTMKEGKYALFPDSVTTRGQKHLKTLMDVKERGMRAVMLYVVQRSDVEVFSPARRIDKEYANLLTEAISEGVELFAMQAVVSPEKIEIGKSLPIEL